MTDPGYPACSSCVREPVGRINVARFIAKLDACLARNDLPAAGKCLADWEAEARGLGDERGLLSVLNEELGYYRRTGEQDKALAAVQQVRQLLQSTGMQTHLSGATILINAATTLKAFGRAQEGMPLYEQAAALYQAENKTGTYEYAALLNNRASALTDLGRYDEAERCYNQAVGILKQDGSHDGEIAVSLINLAHLYFDRDDTAAYERVERTLDEAWEYLTSPRQPHDANYAFILTKCAPSFRYFQRPEEADALEETAKEIYEGV
ncbi:MAG: tetratricopeptide repeat protein [Clostridia bacterium]|nr:tetratricopeptide repeat protein [Clostridia bacterium]